jgi:hypothetical protein
VPLVVVVHAVNVITAPRLVLPKPSIAVPHEHVKMAPLVHELVFQPHWCRIQRVRDHVMVRVDVRHDRLELALARKGVCGAGANARRCISVRKSYDVAASAYAGRVRNSISVCEAT